MKENETLGSMHPGAKLILLVGLCLLGLLVATIAVGLITIFPLTAEGGDSNILARNAGQMRVLQLITQIMLFVVPAFVFAFLVSGRPMAYFQFQRLPSLKNLGFSLFALVVAYPLVLYSAELNQKISLPESLQGLESWMRNYEDSAKEVVDLILGTGSLGVLALNVFVVALVPGVGEELVFRGVVQRIFGQWTGKVHWAVWISAIIFSTIHFQFLGFLPRLILGLVLGYLFAFGRNIWLPIAAHFINNLLVVVAFYLAHNKFVEVDVEAVELGSIGPAVAVLSLVFTVLVFYNFRKMNQNSC